MADLRELTQNDGAPYMPCKHGTITSTTAAVAECNNVPHPLQQACPSQVNPQSTCVGCASAATHLCIKFAREIGFRRLAPQLQHRTVVAAPDGDGRGG